MSAQVDVLAVLRAVRDRAPADQLLAYCDAIAAVAELIEALEKLIDESVHPYDGGEYEDGEWKALDAARAAIARVQGGAA